MVELRGMFRLMFDKLREIQTDDKFDKIIESCRERTYKGKSDSFFFGEIVYIVFNSGMRDKVVDQKLEAITEAFANYDVKAVAEYTEEKVKELMGNKAIIRHEGKIRAIIHNAKEIIKIVKEYGSFEKYLSSFKGMVEPLKDDMVKRFKWFGDTNTYAFQKYVGYAHMAKPDVHVRRVLWRLGLIKGEDVPAEEVLKMCREISEAVGKNLNVVDEVIWAYGSGVNVEKAICGTKPRCGECDLREFCEHQRVLRLSIH